MAYQMSLDMGVVDFAVKAAIKDLSDGSKPLTAERIANHIGCHDSTVRRTLPRLIEAGVIIRHGSKRNGYWYEIVQGVKYAGCR